MTYQGIPASEGISVGEVFHYIPFIPDVAEKYIKEADVEESTCVPDGKQICRRISM